MLKFGLILILSLSIINKFAAQHPVQINITDSLTKIPVKAAHINVISQNNEVTFQTTSDEYGNATLVFTIPSTIVVSHIAYNEKKFSKDDYELLTIKLVPVTIELVEFVITAQSVETKKSESVYEIRTVGLEKIQSRGATQLNEVLGSEANLRLSYRPSFGSNLTMQGFSGEQVNIMVDGVPVAGRFNGSIDLNQINVSDAQRIEILTGPVSVLYGSNSSGGAINIISNGKPAKKYSGKIGCYYETVGQYNGSASSKILSGNNLFSLSFGRNFFDGYSPVDTSRHKLWLQREQYFADAGYTRYFSKGESRLTASYFDETMKDFGERRAPYYTTRFDTHYLTKRFAIRNNTTVDLFKKHTLKFSGSWTNFSRIREKYFMNLVSLEKFPIVNSGESDTTITTEWFLRPVFGSKGISNYADYQIGWEFSNQSIEANRVEGGAKNLTEQAGFAHVLFYPLGDKRVTINPGIRFIYHSIYKSSPVYGLNFNANYNRIVNLIGSYAKGFRAPGIKELFLDFYFNESIQIYGNENLLPENSDHYKLKIETERTAKKTDMLFSVGAFYNRLNNMITTTQKTNTIWQYTNVGWFYSKGIQGGFNLKNYYADASIQFTYTGYKFIQIREDANFRFFYSPEVIFYPSIKYPKYNVFLDVQFKHHGKITNQYVSTTGNLETGFIDSYNLLDVSIRKRFVKLGLIVTVGVKNIFDVEDVEMQGKVYGFSTAKNAVTAPMAWGRSGFFSMIWEL